MRISSFAIFHLCSLAFCLAGEVDTYTGKPLTEFHHQGSAGGKRLIVVGDSRVRNSSDKFWVAHFDFTGWGECLRDIKALDDFDIYNCGIGGSSMRSYINRGYWKRVLELVRPDDIVILYFSGNDLRPIKDVEHSCGEIWGVGSRTVTVLNPYLKRDETVGTYGAYYERIIADVKTRGGIPVICTCFSGDTWKGGKHDPGLSATVKPWIHIIAESSSIKIIDLFTLMEAEFTHREPGPCPDLFAHDGFHLSKKGALLVARLVGNIVKNGTYTEPLKIRLDEPNQALLPTTTSVTAPAGQEPRQP